MNLGNGLKILIIGGICFFLFLVFSMYGAGSSFALGLASAFTPCTIVIVPILLYRFGIWGETKLLVKDTILVLAGYMASFTIIGLLFDILYRSILFDLSKFFLVIVLFSLFVLQLFHKVNFNLFQKISNPFALGLILPLTLSMSACVLPFFTVTIVDAGVSGFQFKLLAILAFGIGVIAPSVLIAIFGQAVFSQIKKLSGVLRFVDYVAAIVIVSSAVYLATRIESFENAKLLTILAVVITASISLLYTNFRKQKLNSILFTLVVLPLLMLIFRLVYLSQNFVTSSLHLKSCTFEDVICDNCFEAAVITGIFVAFLTLVSLVTSGSIKLKKFRLETGKA